VLYLHECFRGMQWNLVRVRGRFIAVWGERLPTGWPYFRRNPLFLYLALEQSIYDLAQSDDLYDYNVKYANFTVDFYGITKRL